MIKRLAFEISYLLKKAPWDTGVSPQELLEFLESNPPGKALDLGCGTGTNAITMAGYGWDVFGVDFSYLAIRRARQKARRASAEIKFRQGDVTRIDPIMGPFNLVLDIGCFHGISVDRRQAYEHNLRSLLKPGGTFLLYTWIKVEKADPSSTPTEHQIHALFDSSIETVRVERGVDEAGGRSSAWFTFRKKPQ